MWCQTGFRTHTVSKRCGLSTVTLRGKKASPIKMRPEYHLHSQQLRDSGVQLSPSGYVSVCAAEAAAARKESLTVTQQVTVCVSSRLRQRQFIVWLSSSKLWTTPGLSPQEHQMGNDLQTVSASSLSRSPNWLTYESRNNAFMMPRLPNSSIWDQISELMGKSPNSWGKTIYWRVLVDL